MLKSPYFQDNPYGVAIIAGKVLEMTQLQAECTKIFIGISSFCMTKKTP
jgi:hypothetical protein